MKNFKRYITILATAFMALYMPLLVHASDNSITIIPAEGNVNCNDYSDNSVIQSMTPVDSSTVSGDGETGDYAITNLTSLSFSDTSVPIDYAVLKSKRTVSVIFYPSGGVYSDANMTIPGDLKISAFELCYGLGNEPAPVNQAPVLEPIGDKEVTDGNDLFFTVSATDDDLPTSPVIFSHSTLPAGASFTDNGDGSGDFEWLGATPAGSTNVTFTVSDGALIDTETITITVNAIPPELTVTPTCEDIEFLDATGIACPTSTFDPLTGEEIPPAPSVVCNMELNKDFYGTADESDICCICNGDGPLVACDPGTPAGEVNEDTGEPSCNLTAAEKAERDLPAAEVTTIIEFNNDPYYCYTSGGRRICYRY